MTQPQAPQPQGSEQRATPAGLEGRRWIKWVLGVSLALNLAVAGVVGGAAVRNMAGGGRPMMVRDLNFGFYSEALSREDRAALRQAFFGQPDAFRAQQRAVRAEFDRLLTALVATPFVMDDVRAIMDQQRAHLMGRLDLGQKLLLERIEKMNPQERSEFAGRLKAALAHRGGRDGAGPGGEPDHGRGD